MYPVRSIVLFSQSINRGFIKCIHAKPLMLLKIISAADSQILLKFGTWVCCRFTTLLGFKVRVKGQGYMLPVNAHQLPKYPYVRGHQVAKSKGGCGCVECEYIMHLVVKDEKEWHDVGRPSSCNASQLLLF